MLRYAMLCYAMLSFALLSCIKYSENYEQTKSQQKDFENEESSPELSNVFNLETCVIILV